MSTVEKESRSRGVSASRMPDSATRSCAGTHRDGAPRATLTLTPAEAAFELRISEDSFMRLVAAGEIDTVDVGTGKQARTRVTWAALEAFLASRTTQRAARSAS